MYLVYHRFIFYRANVHDSYTGTYMMETRRANVNAERKCFHFDWKQSAPAKMRRRKMQTNFWNRFLNDANCFRDTPFMVQQSNINCILYGNICVFIYHLLWCGCTQWRLDTTYARNSQLHNFHIVFSFFFFFASFVLSCVTAWCLGERWTAWMHFFFFCWNALPLTTATNTSARSFFRLWSRFASNNNYANAWADRKWAAAAVQDPSNKKHDMIYTVAQAGTGFKKWHTFIEWNGKFLFSSVVASKRFWCVRSLPINVQTSLTVRVESLKYTNSDATRATDAINS